MKLSEFFDLSMINKTLIICGLITLVVQFDTFHNTLSNIVGYIALILLVVMALGSYKNGFRLLSKRRLIIDTAISKAGSIAPGFVKLKGLALPSDLLASYTGLPCVFYQYIVISGSQGPNTPQGMEQGDSENSIFYVGDETGFIAVKPSNIEACLSSHMTSRVGYYGQRFSEYLIQPGDMVYIIGNAKKADLNTDTMTQEKFNIFANIQKLKKSSEDMIRIDQDHNGEIDEKEWTNAVNELKERVKNNVELDKVNNDFGEMIIERDNTHNLFIVMKEWEYKGYLNKLLFKGVRDFVLGTIMASVIITFLFWYSKGGLIGYIQYLCTGYSSHP
ncbi:MAG: hypothetical protein PHD29_06460 [bacterium]|nr:hypothetical protein [bacterium]